MHGTSIRALFFATFIFFIALSGSTYAAKELKTTEFLGMKMSQDSADILKGGCDSNPFDALRPYIQGGTIIPQKSGTSLRDGIDPELACRLAKFLEYANKSVCKTKIISGYRSAATQQAMCGAGRSGCAPPGRSCHQYGLAVDLSSDCGGRLRKMASQFQLTFPYYGIHVQCAEHRGASRSSCTGPCKGGTEITPDMNVLSQIAASPPQQSLGDVFRQATGLGQQPQPQMPQQQLAQNQQPTQYFQPTQPTPVGSTPTITTQPGQPVGSPAPIGDTGTTKTKTGEPTVKGEPGEFEEEESGAGKKNNSIADQLLILAYGTSSIPMEIATTVPLFVNEKDSAKLKSSGKNASSTASTTSQFASTTSLHPTQTFVSQDISYPEGASIGSRAEILLFLADMRARLLRALEILRPFGLRGVPLTEEHDHRVE